MSAITVKQLHTDLASSQTEQPIQRFFGGGGFSELLLKSELCSFSCFMNGDKPTSARGSVFGAFWLMNQSPVVVTSN